MKSFCFLYPVRANLPNGGLRVMLTYANALAEKGYKVHIAYAANVNWEEKSWYFKCTAIVRYLQYRLEQRLCKRQGTGYKATKWFAVHPAIEEHYCFSLAYRNVPKTDRYICTSPITAEYLHQYPIDNGNKFYFIQGYENWGGVSDARLHKTYHFPMQKVVVARWLKEIIEAEGETAVWVRNGINTQRFYLTIPIAEKERYHISMLYSPLAVKGCQYGLQALAIVQQQYPQVRVSLFGTCSAPNNLPSYIAYYQSPDAEVHNHINNTAAIYLATSLSEGWGLCVGEAMACGQAVVCTDIQGYREMADEQTALFAPPANAEVLAQQICKLLDDNSLRQQLATNGWQKIQTFSTSQSAQLFTNIVT